MPVESNDAKSASNPEQAPPADDRSEILMRHLLRRVSALSDKIAKSENEILEHDNRCLQEEIDILEDRPTHPQKERIQPRKRVPSFGELKYGA